MDRLHEHLNRIGGFDIAFFLAIASAIVFTVLVVLIPLKYRVFLLLVLLSFCQSADKFEALGMLATLCKLSVAPLALFLVIVTLIECRARVRLSMYFAAWLATAMWGVACVARTPDAAIALPISITWLLIVVAAAMLSFTLTSQFKLEQALAAICVGSGIASLVALFALLGQTEISKEYAGRFSPFGANPNQVAMSFMLVVVIGYYFAVNARNVVSRIAYGLLAAIATAELALTLSRAAIGISLITLSPLLLNLSRHPLRLILLCIVSAPVVFLIVQQLENVSSDHLYGSVERAHHWQLGIAEIEKRPFVGLFGTSMYSAIDKDWNAHNAFIQLMYTGGFALSVPVCLLYLLGLYFCLRVYLRRESVFNKSTLGYLALLQVLLVLHGLVNDVLFYPTYASSFLVVVLCFFFRRLYFESQYQM